MSYCMICKREHDERCDLCIYKDDPKSSVPEVFICGNCEYFNNGHFEEDSGIRKYCGYCEQYEMEVAVTDGCSNGIFLMESEEEDD